MVKLLLAWLLLALGVSSISAAEMDVLHAWKYVDFVWDSPEQKQEAIDSGNYNASAIVLLDVDKSIVGQTFVTAIRNKGVPATLMTVTDEMGDGGPLLKPYPDWASNDVSDCDNIIGVYRVYMDNCNRLWVLDTGKIGEDFVCPAKLLAYEIRSKARVKQVTIPDRYARGKNGEGLLTAFAVRLRGNCEDITIYMADTEGYGLVIWDTKDIWRLESDYFKPEEDASTYTVAGESFYLEDGILGLAILFDRDFRNTQLFFRPMSSLGLYSSNVRGLTRSKRNKKMPEVTNHGQLESQSAAMAMVGRVLFFGVIGETALGCWKVESSRNVSTTIIAKDEETLQFPSGLKAIIHTGELLVLSNRYQKLATGTFDTNEVNFRVLSQHVGRLVEDTPCAFSNKNEK